jgi:serine/threonine-protein phosphatase PP1 catalytic subunit
MLSVSSSKTLPKPSPKSQTHQISQIQINNQLDEIIKFLCSFNRSEPARLAITIPMLLHLSKQSKCIFEREPTLLRVNGTAHIFGDIHGQYDDLLKFLDIAGIPPKTKLIFLGDYVDRGNYSLEVVALLFALKLKYPANVFLIRGNHECAEVNREYGFLDECQERFGDGTGSKIWTVINNTLHVLPLALVLNNAVFCVHGGISPEMKSLDDISRCTRGTCIPEDGLLCDLTWSDPKQRQKSEWAMNDRGVSYTFNEKALKTFLDNTGLQMVCRAHQVVKNGYEFYHGSLITVFSAPNYCGDVGNNGAVMIMNENLEFSFIIMKPLSSRA